MNLRILKTATAALAVAVPMAVVPPPGASADGAPEAAQLYVATWGRDSWPGTAEQPFATPERARREVRARTARMTSDIVVNLRAGTYALDSPLRLSEAEGDSGANGHRVVYRAFGYGTPRREPVTLSGGRRISGWRPDGRDAGFWRADVGDLETRQLYVDDRRATPLTAPKVGLPGTPTMTETGYVTDSPAPRSWRDPGDIEAVYRFGYAEGRCGVAGITGDSRQSVITMDAECWRLARKLYGADALKDPGHFENSLSFPHKPGSWYLDRSRPGHHVLLYMPRPGVDMNRASAVAPVLETLVSGTGQPGHPLHDIAFQGITFAHATWLAPSESAGFASAWSMYMRQGKDDMEALTVPGNVAFHTAERITFEGNRFTHLGGQGLEFSKNSSYNTISANVFTDISDGGVLMGVVPPDTKGTNRGNRITDNWIHHTGVDYRASSGIWDTATQDTTIAHNQVHDEPYSGILSGPSEDLRGLMHRNRILNNRVYATNRLLDDGGGIYLRGEQGTSFEDGAVISGNAVTDSKDTEWNIGIYTDDSTNWVSVDRNAAYNYVASIGGCSEVKDGRPIQNVRYRENFWDDAVPPFVKRRDYPGAWPPAEDDCGDPAKLEFTRNTLLNPANPAQACTANPTCAAILTNTGPRPPFRSLLGLR
ncbi:right-handed parallel beta-helix repeat-containing protein [Actinomadura roseirufa]|uniref:right-handed parallel beta-helix repeat-containing protein n=1 Tax=Actinomadura roseirufa TaxID=2094049 RepID=UPI001A954ED6|nr:right-handed parallel beta-helix repeat-containing protein [Actinomadura roseirufa]